MARFKEIDSDIIRWFIYSESSPSGLVWAADYESRGIKHHSCGEQATSYFNGRYYKVCVNGVTVYAHRVIYKIFFPKFNQELLIDHLDGNTTNNRISNLRLVSDRGNRRNTRKSKNNSSGQTGIYYQASRNRWLARWNDNSGIERAKSFPVSKYGSYLKAKKGAAKHRKLKLLEMSLSAESYTDRHGF